MVVFELNENDFYVYIIFLKVLSDCKFNFLY